MVWSGIALHPNRSRGAFIEIRCKPADVPVVVSKLEREHDIITVGQATGMYNIYAILIGTTTHKVLSRINGEFLSPPEVESIHVSLFESIAGGVTWHQGLSSQKSDSTGSAPAIPVAHANSIEESEFVKQLFSGLSTDARKPYTKVASELGRSASSTKDLLDRLVRQDYFVFRVDVARPLFDYELGIKLLLKVPPLRAKEMAAAVGTWHETRFCCSTANTANLIIIASLRSFAFGEAFLERILQLEPSTEIVSRDVNTRVHKVYGWLIAEDGLQDGFIPVEPWSY